MSCKVAVIFFIITQLTKFEGAWQKSMKKTRILTLMFNWEVQIFTKVKVMDNYITQLSGKHIE